MAVIYIGIGSNVGNKEKNFEEALLRIKAKGIRVADRSSFYYTEPVGGPPQEKYLNGVITVNTELSPEKLFDELKDIEKGMGRVPAGKNHPRVIDLDILIYGDIVLDTEKLTVPHKRMHERGFVLKGMEEIAPDLEHPILGKTMRELYREDLSRGTRLK